MSKKVWRDLTEEKRQSTSFRVRTIWNMFLSPGNVQWLCGHMQHVAAIKALYHTETPIRLPAGKTQRQLQEVYENICAFAMEEGFRAIDKKNPPRTPQQALQSI
jgi:hypothetical protein